MGELAPVDESSAGRRIVAVVEPEVDDGSVPRRWWRLALIGAGAVATAFGLLTLFRVLAHPLLLLFAAIVIAEALTPIVEWMAQRLPRSLAVVLVYLVLLLAFAGFGWLVVPQLAAQASQLVAAAPELIDRVQSFFADLDTLNTAQLRGAILTQLDLFGFSLIALPMTLVAALLEIGFIFLMSAYWLLAAPALREFAMSLLPEARRSEAKSVLAEVGEAAGGYVRGKGLSVVIIGVAAYVGLRLIGVDFPLVLALIAGVSELIPIVGIYVALVPAVAVALADSPTQALVVLGFYVVLQQIESNLLLPAIMRSQVGIPPVLALFALFAGERLAGILGALVAIPLAGVLQVLVVRVVAPEVRRWTGAPEPA